MCREDPNSSELGGIPWKRCVFRINVTGDSEKTPGAVIDVVIDYGEVLPENAAGWKTDPWRQIAGANVSGSVLSYSVTDGGPNDADGTINGVIVDPVGVGVLSNERCRSLSTLCPSTASLLRQALTNLLRRRLPARVVLRRKATPPASSCPCWSK